MTDTSWVIGIDLGTGGCRACAVDARGAVLACCDAPYPTSTPLPGWAEQNPGDWYDAAVTALRALLSSPNVPSTKVAAIGLTSAAHIGVLLDDAMQPVRPAILWQDQRTVAEVAELELAAGEEILRQTYQAVSTGWTLPHLCWVRKNEPDAWGRVAHIELSKDYLLRRMTGARTTDPGTALSSQLYDATTGTWSDPLCGLAGTSTAALPAIQPNDSIGGHVTAQFAVATGLPEGIPVIVGGLDSATELIAAGATRPGDAVIRLASAGGVQVVVAGPEPNRRLITYPHATGTGWYRQAGTSTCATAVKWARDIFAPGMSFAEWDELAATSPAGANGVFFEPHLAGERAPYWDPTLRGRISGLSLSVSAADIARAVYEGTAYSIRDALTLLDSEISPATTLSVVGGGAKSRLWTSVLAAVLNRPVRPLPEAHSAAGAAMLALGAVGDGAPAWNSAPSIVEPDSDFVELYERGFHAYVNAHK
ncbi:MAG TPA: FGGY family carbohydrate kinase [Capsulimonadaceae bacterium]|jgi:xylulokinase